MIVNNTRVLREEVSDQPLDRFNFQHESPIFLI